MQTSLRVVLASLLLACLEAAAPNQGLAPLVPRTWNGQQYACKTYYDDPAWPKATEWKQLNASVGGNLEVVIPPAASCHNTFQGLLGNISTYNAAKCAEETAKFADEQWTYVCWA